nr:MAG TPA: hypothetical protein [Caudoviricetes sp.]
MGLTAPRPHKSTIYILPGARRGARRRVRSPASRKSDENYIYIKNTRACARVRACMEY